jgi:hypothetical protein
MTPEERMASWDSLISNLKLEMGNALVATAEDAIGMIKERIQEFGVNAEGKGYQAYTPTYKKKKQIAGKYKGFTDFSFTNRMWTSVSIINSVFGAEESKVTISAKGSNRDILGYNVDRFGQILDLSKIELGTLDEGYKERLKEVYKNAGL